MDDVVDAEEYLLPNKRFFNQSQAPPTPQYHNAAVSISLYRNIIIYNVISQAHLIRHDLLIMFVCCF